MSGLFSVNKQEFHQPPQKKHLSCVMSRLIALTFRSAGGGGGDCSFCTAAGDQSESDQPLGLRLGPHSQQRQSHIRGR